MLEELRRCLKPEKHDRNIFDIVLYGSAAKGKSKPQDIDVAVIFRAGTLKERLAKIQSIKKDIKIETVDIKGILLEELFQESFFGRSGIFLEGISLFDGKPFSYKIDFEGFVLFIYKLENKSHTEKVRFNYVLSGRKSEGVVKIMKGKHVAPGVIQIPIRYSLEFEEILKKHNISYFKIGILAQQ